MTATPVSEIIPRAVGAEPARRPQLSAVPPAAMPASEMRRIWVVMTQLFGHRWSAHFGSSADSPTGEVWSRALAGLSREQIDSGLRAVKDSGEEWPPSMPRFKAMCLGIPAFSAVALELAPGVRDTALSPFARLVWSRLDAFRYRQVDAARAERMLRDAYDLAREHVLQGGQLPPEPVAVLDHEEPEPTPSTPEIARNALASIRVLLDGKSPGSAPPPSTPPD